MGQSARVGLIAGLVLGASVVSAAAQTPSVKLTLDFSIQGQQAPFVCWQRRTAILPVKA